MSIERVATNSQAQYLLSLVMQSSQAVDNTQAQVASGKVATTYAGIGSKTELLEAARSAAARADAYQQSTTQALNQADLQNTQLSSLADLAGQLRQAISDALGHNDATTLMSQAQSIFDQAKQILNSTDANGNYLYGGEKDNTPPLAINQLSDLIALPSASAAFVNGTQKKTVATGDGQTIQIGVLASDVGTDLMQTLKDIATFNAGGSGNFNGALTTAQNNFLTGELPSAITAASNLNTASAANGFTYNNLKDASAQQQSLSTLYQGFVSNIEDVDMGKAVTQLNQNQVALQAALQVTSQLNKVSLLNYLPLA